MTQKVGFELCLWRGSCQMSDDIRDLKKKTIYKSELWKMLILQKKLVNLGLFAPHFLLYALYQGK